MANCPERAVGHELLLVGMAKTLGILRVKDLIAQGIHPEHLRRLCQKGQLVQNGRGLYMLANADVSENITLATVARRFPHGVICLLSALRFHGIGTQNPPDVWIAFKRGTARPKGKDLPLRVMLFSAASFASGTENRTVDSVRVVITNPAKTVADCFKYRNKVGMDVALEALREAIRGRKCTQAEIWKYAKVCRITEGGETFRRIMRPELDADVRDMPPNPAKGQGFHDVLEKGVPVRLGLETPKPGSNGCRNAEPFVARWRADARLP